MTIVVTLANGMTLKMENQPDADVALYRAKRQGWDAVSATPLHGD
jgi:GGDEF domain-containing protein